MTLGAALQQKGVWRSHSATMYGLRSCAVRVSMNVWCCSCRYKAYFRWSHYQFKLQPGLVLPEETEACASVTSAFLQVHFSL